MVALVNFIGFFRYCWFRYLLYCEKVFLFGQDAEAIEHKYIDSQNSLPKSIKDFRKITCCNILYKVIFKIFYNRLKKMLPNLINPTKVGFVEGMTILQNAMLCRELFIL